MLSRGRIARSRTRGPSEQVVGDDGDEAWRFGLPMERWPPRGGQEPCEKDLFERLCAEHLDDIERSLTSGAEAGVAVRRCQQRQRSANGDGDRLVVVWPSSDSVKETFYDPDLRGPPPVAAARRSAWPGLTGGGIRGHLTERRGRRGLTAEQGSARVRNEAGRVDGEGDVVGQTSTDGERVRWSTLPLAEGVDGDHAVGVRRSPRALPRDIPEDAMGVAGEHEGAAFAVERVRDGACLCRYPWFGLVNFAEGTGPRFTPRAHPALWWGSGSSRLRSGRSVIRRELRSASGDATDRRLNCHWACNSTAAPTAERAAVEDI